MLMSFIINAVRSKECGQANEQCKGPAGSFSGPTTCCDSGDACVDLEQNPNIGICRAGAGPQQPDWSSQDLYMTGDLGGLLTAATNCWNTDLNTGQPSVGCPEGGLAKTRAEAEAQGYARIGTGCDPLYGYRYRSTRANPGAMYDVNGQFAGLFVEINHTKGWAGSPIGYPVWPGSNVRGPYWVRRAVARSIRGRWWWRRWWSRVGGSGLVA